MEKDLSITMVRGNLVRDPELRRTNNGKDVANLQVATTVKGLKEFHDVIVFGGEARRCCAELKKGSEIQVIGHNQSKKHETEKGVLKSVEIYSQDIVIVRR